MKGERLSTAYSRPLIEKCGFTLIEIVIVLLIIGIATGLIGIWVNRGSGHLATRTFTKDLTAVLRYARNHAVTEKKIYCLVIDKNERKYRLYAEDVDYTNVKLVMDKIIPETLDMTVRDSEEDSPHIEFFPRGSSTGGIIDVAAEKGDGYSLLINRITGKVDVEKTE